ncbi:MAG: hypothetical protein Q7R54_00100 [bacterium]|nr:hypothetical protein [bacterium]
MAWQDIILSVGSWIFTIALIPSVLSKDKPALSSSLMTGSVLGVYAVTYVTLSLWAAAASTVLVAAMWYTLAIQKVRLDRAAKRDSSAMPTQK